MGFEWFLFDAGLMVLIVVVVVDGSLMVVI